MVYSLSNLKVPLVIGWCLNACQDKGMTLWVKSELILNDIMIND